MAREENELVQETRERLVERIRWHLRESDGKRGHDADGARQHDELAENLIYRLCHQKAILGKAEAYARKAFGRKLELAEEAVTTAVYLLDCAVRNYSTRRGLEERFDSSFHSIVIDAIRKVEASNRRMSEGPKVSLEVVSLDEPTSDGEESGGFTDIREDPSALQAFFEIIDQTAFESIAHRIPPKQLNVLAMKAQGYDFQEIGEKLGVNRETASSIYKKALAFIKNNIAPDSGGESK